MGKLNDETLEVVREAIDQIKRGDVTDGLTTLERTAYPKWQSAVDSEVDYWSRKPVDEIIAAIANDNAVAPATATTQEAAPGAVA